MKYLTFALLILALPASSEDGRILTCKYRLYGVDFAEVSIYLFPDGSPASSATITQWGQTHKESFMPEVLAAGEQLHGWLSKEKPNNTLELIVYSDSKAQGNSVMINPQAPLAKEMWGTCN